MNQIKCVEGLEGRLLRQAGECYPGSGFIFQQTPCHTGKWKGIDDVVQGQQSLGIKMAWKLSTYESHRKLWDILKHEIHSEPTNKPLTTKRELIERLIKVWFYSEKTTRFCKTLIESMPDRMKALKASKGRQTKY